MESRFAVSVAGCRYPVGENNTFSHGSKALFEPAKIAAFSALFCDLWMVSLLKRQGLHTDRIIKVRLLETTKWANSISLSFLTS
jgi:hypothetical protein